LIIEFALFVSRTCSLNRYRAGKSSLAEAHKASERRRAAEEEAKRRKLEAAKRREDEALAAEETPPVPESELRAAALKADLEARMRYRSQLREVVDADSVYGGCVEGERGAEAEARAAKKRARGGG